MSTGDLWGMLGKQKSTNTLTIPSKKTTNTSNNTTSAPTATANTTVQAKTVSVPKVRPQKVKKHKVQQHSQTQITEPRIDDFNVSTTGDANGIYITILHIGRPLYKFTLPNYDFDTWQYRMDANQRLQYVKLRVNASAAVFGNNAQIIQAVIMAIYNILTNIFAEAERVKAQQAQKRI